MRRRDCYYTVGLEVVLLTRLSARAGKALRIRAVEVARKHGYNTLVVEPLHGATRHIWVSPSPTFEGCSPLLSHPTVQRLTAALAAVAVATPTIQGRGGGV